MLCTISALRFVPDDSAEKFGVKNVTTITQSLSVSDMYVFLDHTQKFKMVTKNGRKTSFRKSVLITVKKVEKKNNHSGTVSEKSMFLCFTQKFKMTAKCWENEFWGKS